MGLGLNFQSKESHSSSNSTQNITNNTDNSQTDAKRNYDGGASSTEYKTGDGAVFNITAPAAQQQDNTALVAAIAASSGNQSASQQQPYMALAGAPSSSVAGEAGGKPKWMLWLGVGAGVASILGLVVVIAKRKGRK